MGHVILPTGTTMFVDDIKGSINLSQLINDVQSSDYTSSFRISTIETIAKLKKNAISAVSHLKTLAANKDEPLIAEAAEQAIKKIEDSDGNKHKSHVHGVVGANHGVNYAGYNYSNKKPDVNKVVFTEIKDESLDDGLKKYGQCNFCDKMTAISGYQRRFSERLAGPDNFFCNFCIRNDYHNRYNKNIMVLTYRGIIGYYYYSFIGMSKSQSMWLMDLREHVELHAKIGSQNPIFRYDPESFCWFLDFNKIGKRKAPIEWIFETIIQQICAFNLYENVKECSPKKLYEKYKTAVMEFHQHRQRHDNDKVFSPTLFACDIPVRVTSGQKGIPVEMLQGFVPSHMEERGVKRA